MSSSVSIHLTTFNCGRTLLTSSTNSSLPSPTFASSLFPSSHAAALPPDLLVLSLQEIAPIAHSFIGGSFLAPYFVRFLQAVNVAAGQAFGEETRYEEVLVKNVGMTGLMVLARGSVKERVQVRGVGGVGVGWWEMGNKGAAGIRVGIHGEGGEEDEVVEVTFVAAHLAPHEDGWKRRNEDWRGICEGLVLEAAGGERGRAGGKNGGEEAEPLLSSSDGASGEARLASIFSPLTHVFFAGDLNYRTADTSPSPEAYKTWPNPTTSTASSDTADFSKTYGVLFTNEQLTRERKAGRTLHNLSEAEIKFPPTYKYSAAAQQNAQTSSNEAISTLWAKHRTPSWCDRILYLSAVPPKVQSYTAGPIQSTSDHRPVTLTFSVPLSPLKVSSEDVKPPFAIRSDWKEARAAARRYEFVVGVAAYLALTWEGEALLLGSVVGVLGGYVVLRTMLGT